MTESQAGNQHSGFKAKLTSSLEDKFSVGDLVVVTAAKHPPWAGQIKKIYYKAKVYLVKYVHIFKLAYVTKDNIFPLSEQNKEKLTREVSGEEYSPWKIKLEDMIDCVEFKLERRKEMDMRKQEERRLIPKRQQEKLAQIKKEKNKIVYFGSKRASDFDLGLGFEDIVNEVKASRKYLTQPQVKIVAQRLSRKVQRKWKKDKVQDQSRRPFFVNQAQSSDSFSDSESQQNNIRGEQVIQYENHRFRQVPYVPQIRAPLPAGDLLDETQVETNYEPTQDNWAENNEMRNDVPLLRQGQKQDNWFIDAPDEPEHREHVRFLTINTYIRKVKKHVKRRSPPHFSTRVLKPLSQKKKALVRYVLNIDLLIAFIVEQMELNIQVEFSQQMLIVALQTVIQALTSAVYGLRLLEPEHLKNATKLLELVFENNLILMSRFLKSKIIWDTQMFIRAFETTKVNLNEELTVLPYWYLKAKYNEWGLSYEDRCRQQGVAPRIIRSTWKLFQKLGFHKQQ